MTGKQFISLLKDYWYLPAGLVLIAAVLFGISKCGTWRSDRDIDKQKANINAALSNIANKESVIANLQTEIAVEKEAVKHETNSLLNNINATNEAKTQTNAALANLDKARNANTTNSSAEQLEKLLEGLQ